MAVEFFACRQRPTHPLYDSLNVTARVPLGEVAGFEKAVGIGPKPQARVAVTAKEIAELDLAFAGGARIKALATFCAQAGFRVYYSREHRGLDAGLLLFSNHFVDEVRFDTGAASPFKLMALLGYAQESLGYLDQGWIAEGMAEAAELVMRCETWLTDKKNLVHSDRENIVGIYRVAEYTTTLNDRHWVGWKSVA